MVAVTSVGFPSLLFLGFHFYWEVLGSPGRYATGATLIQQQTTTGWLSDIFFLPFFLFDSMSAAGVSAIRFTAVGAIFDLAGIPPFWKHGLHGGTLYFWQHLRNGLFYCERSGRYYWEGVSFLANVRVSLSVLFSCYQLTSCPTRSPFWSGFLFLSFDYCALILYLWAYPSLFLCLLRLDDAEIGGKKKKARWEGWRLYSIINPRLAAVFVWLFSFTFCPSLRVN